jgi:hypothetical protein
VRYVTNEQRRRRTLFKPTLWAVASWLIFGVAHSLRIDLDMLVVTGVESGGFGYVCEEGLVLSDELTVRPLP